MQRLYKVEWDGKMIINDELQRICKVAVVADFKILLLHSSLKEIMKISE
jgi:hypothetical protein